MRYFIVLLVVCSLTGCKKGTPEPHQRVDIYLLKSFAGTNAADFPYIYSISSAVLEDSPIVKDEQIYSYNQREHVFSIAAEARNTLKNLNSTKAFAVTVDKEVIYYGRVHPAYMSSLISGLATIDPMFYENDELAIKFLQLSGDASAALTQLDKRNDTRIIRALKVSRRLK